MNAEESLLFCGIIICSFSIFCIIVKGVRYFLDRPYYAMVSFYVACYIQSCIFSGRVREIVAGQIVIFLVHFILVYIAYKRDKYKNLQAQTVKEFQYAWLPLIIIISVSSLNGFLQGYSFFQILVDIYKVSEILIYYYLLVLSCRKITHLKQLLNALILVAFALGILQMFTTARGGLGMQMVMCYFPLYFASNFNKSSKLDLLLLFVSFAIVFFCQTRTYMAAYLMTTVLLFSFMRGRYKFETGFRIFCLALLSVLVAFYLYYSYPEGKIAQIVARIGDLSKGFEEEGGYRLYEIQTAISKFNDAPFWGKGYGFKEYLYIKEMGYFEWGDFMHNAYVEILMKTGIFGVSVIFISFAILCQKVIAIISNRKVDVDTKNVILSGICGSLTWLLILNSAPKSTFGMVFISLTTSLLYYKLTQMDNPNLKNCNG